MECKKDIAIIGMGFLMSYLKPCYINLFGNDLSNYIYAITRSEETALQKEKEMVFSVYCQNYLENLKKFGCMMLFFSPPPSAAKEMTDNILVPYYEYLRMNKESLPDLYAFPPSPTGEYYESKLGKDVNIVNILPNMASKLDGRDIAKQSYTILTFPKGHQWDEESYNRLTSFFEPLGYTVSMPIEHTTSILGCFVCSHIIEEVCITLAEGIKNTGFETLYSDIASTMRFYLKKSYNRHYADEIPCSNKIYNENINAAFFKCLDAFIDGMVKFNKTREIDEKLSLEIIVPQTDIFLQSAQILGVEQININNSHHATKGGILEKALETYKDLFEIKLLDSASKAVNGVVPVETIEVIKSMSEEIARQVAEHGARFAD